jgi:hypothetical protein
MHPPTTFSRNGVVFCAMVQSGGPCEVMVLANGGATVMDWLDFIGPEVGGWGEFMSSAVVSSLSCRVDTVSSRRTSLLSTLPLSRLPWFMLDAPCVDPRCLVWNVGSAV